MEKVISEICLIRIVRISAFPSRVWQLFSSSPLTFSISFLSVCFLQFYLSCILLIFCIFLIDNKFKWQLFYFVIQNELILHYFLNIRLFLFGFICKILTILMIFVAGKQSNHENLNGNQKV